MKGGARVQNFMADLNNYTLERFDLVSTDYLRLVVLLSLYMAIHLNVTFCEQIKKERKKNGRIWHGNTSGEEAYFRGHPRPHP